MMGWNDIMGNKIHEYNSSRRRHCLKIKNWLKERLYNFGKEDLDLIEETAQKGYDIVNSYHYGTYLDYDKSRIPLAKSYKCSILFLLEWISHYNIKFLGLGCQMWGEQILTVESMNRDDLP